MWRNFFKPKKKPEQQTEEKTKKEKKMFKSPSAPVTHSGYPTTFTRNFDKQLPLQSMQDIKSSDFQKTLNPNLIDLLVRVGNAQINSENTKEIKFSITVQNEKYDFKLSAHLLTFENKYSSEEEVKKKFVACFPGFDESDINITTDQDYKNTVFHMAYCVNKDIETHLSRIENIKAPKRP